MGTSRPTATGRGNGARVVRTRGGIGGAHGNGHGNGAWGGDLLRQAIDSDVVDPIAGGEVFGAWKSGPALHDFAVDIQAERAMVVQVGNAKEFHSIEKPCEFVGCPKKGADVEVFRKIERHDLLMSYRLVVESDTSLHIWRSETMEGCKVGPIEIGFGHAFRGISPSEDFEDIDFFGKIAFPVFGGRIERIVQPKGIADIGAHSLETGLEVAVQDTFPGCDVCGCVGTHAAGAVERRNFIRLLHCGGQFKASVSESDIASIEIAGSAADPLRGGIVPFCQIERSGIEFIAETRVQPVVFQTCHGQEVILCGALVLRRLSLRILQNDRPGGTGPDKRESFQAFLQRRAIVSVHPLKSRNDFANCSPEDGCRMGERVEGTGLVFGLRGIAGNQGALEHLLVDFDVRLRAFFVRESVARVLHDTGDLRIPEIFG